MPTSNAQTETSEQKNTIQQQADAIAATAKTPLSTLTRYILIVQLVSGQ